MGFELFSNTSWLVGRWLEQRQDCVQDVDVGKAGCGFAVAEIVVLRENGDAFKWAEAGLLPPWWRVELWAASPRGRTGAQRVSLQRGCTHNPKRDRGSQ